MIIVCRVMIKNNGQINLQNEKAIHRVQFEHPLQPVEDIGKLVHDSEWKPIGIAYLFNNHEIDDSEHGLDLERGATSKEDCQWHIKEDTLMVNAKEEDVVGNDSNLSNFCYEVEYDIDMQEQARNK